MNLLNDIFVFEINDKKLNFIGFINYFNDDISLKQEIASKGIEFILGNDIQDEVLDNCFPNIAAIQLIIETFTGQSLPSAFPLTFRLIVDPKINGNNIIVKIKSNYILGVSAYDYFLPFDEDFDGISYISKYRDLIENQEQQVVLQNTKTQNYFKTKHPIVINKISLRGRGNISIYSKLFDIFLQESARATIFYQSSFVENEKLEKESREQRAEEFHKNWSREIEDPYKDGPDAAIGHW